MLRNFHYIDEKGKDEGVCIVCCFMRPYSREPIRANHELFFAVRNRTKEFMDFVSVVDKIRNECRKAKVNKHRYIGTGNKGASFCYSSGGRYGGFGSDTVHGSDWS